MKRMLTLAALLLVTAHAQGPVPSEAEGEWRLTAIETPQGRFSPSADTRVPTLTVDGTRVSGDAGCNRYSGAFGSDGRIGPLASTRRACPAGRDVEATYLRLLGGTRVNSAAGNRLLLTREGVLLEFVRTAPGGSQGTNMPGVVHPPTSGGVRAPSLAELMGDWSLLTVNGQAAADLYAEPVTLEVTPVVTLTLRGSDGCNAHIGAADYDAASGVLRGGVLPNTRRACPAPHQSPPLLPALRSARLQLVDGRLLLRGDGHDWVFIRR